MGQLLLWVIMWLLQPWNSDEAAHIEVRKLPFNQSNSLPERILQQINSTSVDNISSTWFPISSTAKHRFQNTNAAQDRGKRETDTNPSHIAVLYPVDSKRREGPQRSNKHKRCQGRIRNGKVHHNSFQKGITSSNNMKKDDDVNYYKSTYPSLTADSANERDIGFRVDNDGVPKVKLTAATQAVDNGCEANTPHSFAGYIQQASNSDEGRGEGARLQQLLTAGNGYRAGSDSLKEHLKNNRREPKFNKHKFWKPSEDKNGQVNTEYQNEGSTKTSTQISSHFLSDSYTDPSLQNGLGRLGPLIEYHYPHDDTKSVFQNPPLKERVYQNPTLSAKDLFKNNYFPQSSMYHSHQHDNAQILDSELYGNRYENIYWEPETQSEYQDAPTNLELKHNMKSITDSEPFITGHVSEDNLNKDTGINEDIRHNMVVSGMPLYPSSGDRRLMQDHFLSQNGINNSPYIQGPPSNMERYLPGKSSGVLQEDAVSVHSMPGAKDSSIHYSEKPAVSSKKLKLSSSQDGMWRKDSRLTTENSILSLPTASHNIIPSNLHKHTPKFHSDFDEMINNRDSQKLNNDIASTHQDVPVTSHYISHKNKIPSGELSCFTEVNEPKEGLQLKYKNEYRTSPHNYEVPPLTNVPTWEGPMTDHSEYTQRVASTSHYRDEAGRYFSSNGRNPAFKNIHFPTSIYQVTEQNEDLPPHKYVPTSQYYHEMSTPPNNINIENVAFQSRTEPQLLNKRPTNNRLKEGTNNMKVSVSEEGPYDESTFISEISDISKYLPSASEPSSYEARTGILWVPEGKGSVTSSANHDGRFNLQTNSQKSQPSFDVGMVSDQTKSEFSRIFQNTINDLHSVPISSVTSLKHAHLASTQTSLINTETRSKSEDMLLPVNTLVPQYTVEPAEVKDTLAGIYSAATYSPLLTTVTVGAYLPGSSEAYPQMAVLNGYKNARNMGEDVAPTLHSNGGYKNTLHSVTEAVTAEQNHDVSNSATELPYEFKKQSFPESVQSDTNFGKEMQEKPAIESEQSTSVMPNLYKMNEVQHAALSTADTSDNDANTGDITEQTNLHATGLPIDELKNQIGSVPMNTKYEPIARDEVTQGQDTNYSVTSMTDLQSEPQYIPLSDVADKLDAHTAMASTAASEVYKNTNPRKLLVPDKRPSPENEGNYYFPTATVSLPETVTNTVYINAEPPEMLTPIQEQILHQVYSTTIMPPETEVHVTTKKTELKLIQVPETAINYKGKVLTHTAGDEPVAPRDTGLEREQRVLEKGADYESDKPIPAHEFSEDHEEQTDTQKDVENILKTKKNERNDLNMIQVPETAINYRADVPTQTVGYELVTPRDKGHEREQMILGKGADYESDKPRTAHKFSENYNEQTNTQKDTENIFMTRTNDKTDFEIAEVPEPGINYKVKVPIYITGDKLLTSARGKGHEREQLTLDEGDVYKSDKRITTHQFSDNNEEQINTYKDFEDTFTTKAIENYTSPGILKAETYKFTLAETTTFQTVATPTAMNGITVTSSPTERSDTPQSMYFTIQDEDGRTGNINKYNNDKDLVQKNDPQYLHTDEYDISHSNHLSTTAQEKRYNNEHTGSPSNMESDFEDAALDVRNQNGAHKDEEEEKGLHAFYFTVPTLAPQQNGVTSNYIQLYETQLGESTQSPPEIQNKQNNVIPDEQSMNGYTPPLEITDHAEIPALQHLTLGLQNSESFLTKNISLGKIGDMTKSLQDIVNSTKNIKKPHQDQDFIPDHNERQLSDSLQPAVYARNKEDTESETKDANHVPFHQEILSPSYNRQLVPEHNTDSSTLQIQSQYKNAERYHSSLQQTAEPKHTHKNHNEEFDTATQYTSPHPLTEIKEQECCIHCNNILISQSKDREDYVKKEGKGKSILFPPDDVTGILPEYIQSRNGIGGSMEPGRSDDLGEILRDYKNPEYVSRIVTNNEKPEGVTEAAKENKPGVMRNGQAGGVRTEYNQMEEEPDYKQPDDPTTLRRDYKQPEYELQVEYTTEDHKVLQSGVVTEQTMTLQGESKRTRNTQNLYTTNAIKESGEDTRNTMNTYKKTLMFLLQNKEKIQLLLDLPYSYTMTSTPALPIRREIQSRLNREPTEDQGQVIPMNLAFKKIKPSNVDYSSIETTDINLEQPKHVNMDSVKSHELSPVESLGGKNRQAKFLKDMHTAKSDRCKTTSTFNDEHNLRNQETLQQPCISRKEYSSPTFMVPSVNVDRSDRLRQRNKQPKQKLELKPGIRDSDDTWGTSVNLAHLPSQNSMRTECSNCGPWALHKNYFSMPSASPRLDHHLFLSEDESLSTVPTSSYETNISSDPEYDYEMDSSLESYEMEQDSSLNFHNQQHSRNKNVQRSDTLSEKGMTLQEDIIDYDAEDNQSLPDDSELDTGSPQLFKFYMYNDDKSSQPKSYNKRKSNSNHNVGYIPEESYQKLIKDDVVSTRPVSTGNWKKYKGSPEGIMHPKPCTSKKRSYKTHKQHSPNEDNIRSFSLGFKERKMNKGYNDDNAEIRHYNSGKRKYEQPSEWEFLNTENRQSSPFSEAYDQSKEHSSHGDCSEETITQASPEISLKNANKFIDGDTIRTSVNDPSYDTEVSNRYNNNNNYKKILPSVKMQKISKNNYKYSNDYDYPIKYHELSMKDNGQRFNDIHQTIPQHLLHQNNNRIFHPPEDNDNSWGDAYQTNVSDENNVIRRTRNAMQYTTTGSPQEKEKDLYPQYQSRSCQSYNCEGVLASEVKIVTAILKWLNNMVTDIKKT
ncbi:uncharacterized protein LOC111873699 [Cryptotermes secundus]|uniref:uncharacterized protein LOC111873699 n=1 Tax=Cryptotermes secundus TaxID=105785 RepID=UPI000CD7D948|nr:uncharacterized protein LOC111873699 [Cryptotermes secundus]